MSEQKLQESTNLTNNMDNRLTKVETCMQYIQKDIEEIKTLIKELGNSFLQKDEEYNKRFATKKEIEDLQTKKLTRHPIFVSVVSGLIFVLLIIALKNLGQL